MGTGMFGRTTRYVLAILASIVLNTGPGGTIARTGLSE